MARVTVEDCLARIPNRFALTILGSRRARMLGEGRGTALVDCDNKEGVTALREIAADHVRYDEDVDEVMREFIDEQRRQLRVTTGEHTFLEAASLRAMDGDVDEGDIEDDDDVEELPADPEAISQKAKSQTEQDATVEDEEEDEDAEFDGDEDDAADPELAGDLADDGDDESDDEDEDE